MLLRETGHLERWWIGEHGWERRGAKREEGQRRRPLGCMTPSFTVIRATGCSFSNQVVLGRKSQDNKNDHRNSKPRHLKEDKHELTWAMVVELQELVLLFGLPPLEKHRVQRSQDWGRNRKLWDQACLKEIPRWLKLTWSCFAFFLLLPHSAPHTNEER